MTRMTWLAVAGLLVGCASGAPASAPVAGADGFATSGSLDNTRWSLVDSRLTAAPPEDRNAVRLEFTADRLNARGGCNTSAGGYRLEDGVLSLTGQMATTMRACIGPGAEFEPEFLAFLASHSGEVISKRDLLAEVWREPYGGSESTVDVHLSWLRKKLGETAAEPRLEATLSTPAGPRRLA